MRQTRWTWPCRRSGCDQMHIVHKPRRLSDNASSYVSGDLTELSLSSGRLWRPKTLTTDMAARHERCPSVFLSAIVLVAIVMFRL